MGRRTTIFTLAENESAPRATKQRRAGIPRQGSCSLTCSRRGRRKRNSLSRPPTAPTRLGRRRQCQRARRYSSAPPTRFRPNRRKLSTSSFRSRDRSPARPASRSAIASISYGPLPPKCEGRRETMPLTTPGQFGFTVRQPLGVIAGIAPFNAPFLLAMKKVVMALAAGNGFILKPLNLRL